MIKLEPSKWQAKKDSLKAEKLAKVEEVAMKSLREKSLKGTNKSFKCSRKRGSDDMENLEEFSPIVLKKPKQDATRSQKDEKVKSKSKSKFKKIVQESKSSFVKNWLLSNKDRSSTPIKDDQIKSSQSEMNVNPCESDLAGVALSERCSTASGYSADVSTSVKSSV